MDRERSAKRTSRWSSTRTSSCAKTFNFEPWYPTSNTVKSPRGWYSITVRDNSSLSLQPTDRLRFIRKTGQGRLFQYGVADRNHVARFVHVPRSRRAPLLEVSFWGAMPDSTKNWRVSPQVPYPADEYDRVLQRLAFEPRCSPTCLNAQRLPRGCAIKDD